MPALTLALGRNLHLIQDLRNRPQREPLAPKLLNGIDDPLLDLVGHRLAFPDLLTEAWLRRVAVVIPWLADQDARSLQSSANCVLGGKNLLGNLGDRAPFDDVPLVEERSVFEKRRVDKRN